MYGKSVSSKAAYRKFAPTPKQAKALLKYIQKLEEKAEVEDYGNDAWTETASDAIDKLNKIQKFRSS